MTSQNILITGISGLVGSALRQCLSEHGYTVYGLDRYDHTAPFYYNQTRGIMTFSENIPLEAVINLAGASLASGRWNAQRKKQIYDSRILTTQHLCERLAALPTPPAVLLSASAMGYYGQTGAQIVDEDSPVGTDFLASIAHDWEAATGSAQQAGIRTVFLRFGLVLSMNGGVLPNFILPGRLAAVGRIGDGQQYLSWISLPDALQTIMLLLSDKTFSGPINLVSNHELTNREFTSQISKALGRPRVPPLPAAAVKLLFGEMGEATLLSSSRVHSKRFSELGFAPTHEELPSALQVLL